MMGINNKIVIASVSLLLLLLACHTKADVFDVTKYGAKADGKTDISQALTDAWKAACASPTPSKIVVPKGNFLLGQGDYQGPCKAPIEFQLAGTLQAPEDPQKMKAGEGWVSFTHINDFTVSGGGVFDGRGETAWGQNDCAKTGKCHKLPQNLRFSFLTNAYIHDVTTKDSKLFHVNVLGCKNITFDHFTVSAPKTSLNTDGIHVGRSNGVKILNSDIKTGDDCISIGDGSQEVYIEKVTCGPGHGISVGSLGKYANEEPVTGIHVKGCTLTDTDNGVRIKTWPASKDGSASDMHFEDITMNNVGNPVLIDQEYCPYNQCTLGVPSRIKISNVSFKGIKGTSSTPLAVKLVCSKGFPCQNVEIGDINLVYTGAGGATSQCANIKPKFTGHQNIPICATSSQ